MVMYFMNPKSDRLLANGVVFGEGGDSLAHPNCPTYHHDGFSNVC